MKRCQWVTSEILQDYHDHVWGIPTHDERQLYKMLILEGLQAGLSWETVLKKEQYYSDALDDFDYHKIALYDEKKYDELMNTDNLIKNKLKMKAIINNAKAFIRIQEDYGSFDYYIWSYTDYKTIIHYYEEAVSYDDLSILISKDLKKKGFTFVGPTIIYSYLQAIGMYNDHDIDCDFKNDV